MNINFGTDESGKPVEISLEQLAHHLYILGRSGMGKTGCLCNICIQLMQLPAGVGMIVIDCLGSLIEMIKTRIPDDRVKDVILFQARDREHPFALNPLAPPPTTEKLGERASNIMSIFQLAVDDAEWNSRTKQAFRNLLILLLSRKKGLMGQDWPACLDEVSPFLSLQIQDEAAKRRWNQGKTTTLREIWYEELEESGNIPVLRYWRDHIDQIITPRLFAELFAALGGVTDSFNSNPLVRNIVGQTQNKLDLLDAMNTGKIILADLSGIGDDNADFLGSVLMAELASTTLMRDRGERRFYIVADEISRYGTTAFWKICTQGRELRVHLITAQQDQTNMRLWQKGFMGNASNRVYFQLVPTDATEQAREFDATPPEPEPDYQPIYGPYRPPTNGGLKGSTVNARLLVDLATSIEHGEKVVGFLEGWIDTGYDKDERKEIFLTRLKDYFSFVDSLAHGPPAEWEFEFEFTDGTVDYFMENWVDLARESELLSWARSEAGKAIELLFDEDAVGTWMKDPTGRACVAWIMANPPSETTLRIAQEALLAVRSHYRDRAVYVQQPATAESSLRLVMTEPGNGSHYASYREETTVIRGPTLFRKVSGRTRPYSDVYLEIANNLTHLPARRAVCKLVGPRDGDRPIELVFKTIDLPEPNSRWEENWKQIEHETWRAYTRLAEEVEIEVRARDQAMRRAVQAWHIEEAHRKDGYEADDEDPGGVPVSAN